MGLYLFRLSLGLEKPELVETRNSMMKTFYFYLMEKLFLHVKSCIRISLNWRNQLSKETTLVYPYFSVWLKSSNATTLVFYEQRKSGNKGQSRDWPDGQQQKGMNSSSKLRALTHCSHFEFYFFISLFCYVFVLFFIFRADTSLFLFNLIYKNLLFHIFLIIITIIRCSEMFLVLSTRGYKGL